VEGTADVAKLGLVQQFAQQLSGGVTSVLLLENLVPASMVRDDQERKDVSARPARRAARGPAVVPGCWWPGAAVEEARRDEGRLGQWRAGTRVQCSCPLPEALPGSSGG
jgi:hypothetical protein